MRRKTGLIFPLWMVACLAIPATAAAQAEDTAVADAPAEAPAEVEEEEPERFVVTGSRIKRKEVSTAAPVTVLTRDELLRTGIVSVGEILQRLPAQGNAVNVAFNNGGNGTATVDLRSLGTQRTLVLLNGRRFVPGGDGANAAVDLNAIPVTIIERVEVLKDGASSVYGSDAIAGVVNIITRSDFVGIEASAYSGISQRNDGANYQLDLTTGFSGEKGNIVASMTFFDQQPIFAGEREYSELARGFDYDEWEAAGSPSSIDFDAPYIFPNGSSATPQGRTTDQTGALGNAAYDATGCRGGLCFNDSDVGWRPWAGFSDTYNFQPENYLVTPNRRYNFFTQGNYEINEYVTAFFELSYTDRRSTQLLAPTPFFGAFETPPIPVSGENIFNPFNRDFADVRRRLLELDNRIFTQNSRTSRIVVGLQGEIPDFGPFEDWSWDFYGNFGRTDTTNVESGLPGRDRTARALGPASGCTGDDGCVPLNLFGGAGSITQEMLDYISSTLVSRGFSDQQIYAANIAGPIFEIVPDNPVGLAFGYQYRREAGADIPDPLTATGAIIGNAREPTKGRFDVNAFYAELSAPLIADQPGVELLELNAAARFVDFSAGGSDAAFKVGLRWQVLPWLAARGTYSTAFRGPSVAELFSGAVDAFPGISDPCSAIPNIGSLDDPNVAAQCAREGLAAGVVDDRTQINAIGGGNPDLEAETAVIITGGLVISEDLVPGLSINVDYYNIDVDNAIASIGAGTILSSCYESNEGERQFCELVNRNAAGLITNINNTLANVGGLKTSGFDTEVRYSLPTEYGRFGINAESTYLLDYTIVQATGFEQDVTDTFFDDDSYPDLRVRSQIAWMLDQYNAGFNIRYVSNFRECEGSDSPCSTPGALSSPPRERDIGSYVAADVYAGVNLDVYGQTALTVGINNFLDVSPPFIAEGFLAESDPATYDFVGRFFYFRLTQRF